MSCHAYPASKSLITKMSRFCRRGLCVAIFAVLGLLLLQTLLVESFHVPTGSMAPALNGHHRVCICPRCGAAVAIGRHASDTEGTGNPRFYRKAFCANCGFYPLDVSAASETAGDQIVVNKSAYILGTPSRWEIVVFRLLGTYYIKRLLGLPGEEILIHDGDIYVNGELVRKTLAEARALRVLVFDQDHAPPGGWKDRWESSSARGLALAEWSRSTSAKPQAATGLALDGRTSPTALTYRHYSLDLGKCEPIRDECAYNGGLHADRECVHDFLIETEIVAAGRGSIALRLCDGHDWVEVLVPVGAPHAIEAFAWPIDAPTQTRKLAESEKPIALKVNQRSRVEMAFVDRRLSLAIDGAVCLSVDLPALTKRVPVERPFQVQVDGVTARLERFRLYRDVHYGQQGKNAVNGKAVRLEVDQYFMLGDNSPNSEDSRYWPDDGRVGAACLVGPVVFVHGR